MKKFFWLHIKKSAGTTVRELLSPYYKPSHASVKQPKNFIQSKPEEYNGVLNNFRIPLGNYQFKRCQFAKKYLYKDEWESMYSFSFSREPVDRCISMFHYLYWKGYGPIGNFKHYLKRSLKKKKFLFNEQVMFDAFLDYALNARDAFSVNEPLGLHFSTHTAPMWPDITDEEGNIMLTKIYRMEELVPAINQVFEICSIDKVVHRDIHLNKGSFKKVYAPKAYQISKIKEIYGRDFDIYESAGL